MKKRRSSNVPGQFLGYSLQTTRALQRLLVAPPGSFVSVEVLDDVASTSGDSARLVQTKSATSSNPVADRSPELWKTLANWVRGVVAGQIDPTRTTLELFVSRKRAANLAEMFASANDTAAAAQALAVARESLLGVPPKYEKRPRLSKALAPHVAEVLEANEQAIVHVITAMSLVFGSGSSKADILNVLSAKLISPDMLETVARQMLGWVKETIDGLIEKGMPAIVATDAFNAELLGYVRKYDRFAILNSFAPQPAASDVAFELQNKTYVRQLEIIGADFDAQLKAVNDCLRASVDRTIWATKGLVHRSSFNEFEDALTRAWEAKRQIVAIQAKGKPADECGLLLYSECSLGQHLLESRPVPPHFAPGCYHALADSLTIGWHPEFKTLLSISAKKDPAA